MMNNFEKVCEDTSNLRSPVEDSEGNLYLATENGAVKRVRDGQLLVSGQHLSNFSLALLRNISKLMASSAESL